MLLQTSPTSQKGKRISCSMPEQSNLIMNRSSLASVSRYVRRFPVTICNRNVFPGSIMRASTARDYKARYINVEVGFAEDRSDDEEVVRVQS